MSTSLNCVISGRREFPAEKKKILSTERGEKNRLDQRTDERRPLGLRYNGVVGWIAGYHVVTGINLTLVHCLT
jgi:hypothetical protein